MLLLLHDKSDSRILEFDFGTLLPALSHVYSQHRVGNFEFFRTAHEEFFECARDFVLHGRCHSSPWTPCTMMLGSMCLRFGVCVCVCVYVGVCMCACERE